MRRPSRRFRTRLTIAMVIGGVAAVVSSASSGASTVAYDGVLGIHGPGSVFAGTDASGLEGAYVSLVAAPGGTVSFPVEVLNKGTIQSQYQVDLAPDGVSHPQLLAGTLDVTSLAEQANPHGYETVPVAPVKATALTLKITVPKTALPSDHYFARLTLWSPGEDVYLGAVVAAVQIKSSTGTSGNDVFATSSGQSSVRGVDLSGQRPWVTASTIKAGSSTAASFALTLKNDGTTSTKITLYLAPVFACSTGSFIPTVKVGTTDVTAAAFGDAGYTTPLLAKTGSKAVTLTVKSVLPHPDFSACANVEAYTADVTTGGNTNGVVLITNAIVS